MKIISIDPGYDRCGIACIERKEDGKETLLDSMCIVTNKNDSFETRIYTVADTCAKWLKKYQPDVCALETLFFTSNQKTAMRVAETRGALLFVATAQSVPVCEFTPKQVKIAVTGDGSAPKKQLIVMVQKLITVGKEIQYDDEYDAIAVGLTASASLSGERYAL
jgi:crossover junction endodeoxyribonuclease RuvC